MDENMQVFLERSAGADLPVEPLNVDDLDPFADLDPLAVGGVPHHFLQPLDLLTGEDQHEMVRGGNFEPRTTSAPDLPFHGPNSPASTEDLEFLSTEEEQETEDTCEKRGNCLSHSDETVGWAQTVDIVPGDTDFDQLLHEPWGDELPEGENDAANLPTAEQGEGETANKDENWGQSKWYMQQCLREGRRTAWSKWDVLGEDIYMLQEEIDKKDRSFQRAYHRRTAQARSGDHGQMGTASAKPTQGATVGKLEELESSQAGRNAPEQPVGRPKKSTTWKKGLDKGRKNGLLRPAGYRTSQGSGSKSPYSLKDLQHRTRLRKTHQKKVLEGNKPEEPLAHSPETSGVNGTGSPHPPPPSPQLHLREPVKTATGTQGER